MSKKGKVRQLKTEKAFEGYFEEIYSAYFDSLYLFARSLAKSDDLAKDVVSEVFFNLWKSNSDVRQIKEIKSYLFRSVKNQVIRTLSNDPRNFVSIDTENYVKQIEKVDPEEILLEKELLDIINAAISKLPDQCQLIFKMAKDQQMSYSEISAELGISQSTIKTQVARALTSLKNAIEQQYDQNQNSNWRSVGLGCLMLLIFIP